MKTKMGFVHILLAAIIVCISVFLAYEAYRFFAFLIDGIVALNPSTYAPLLLTLITALLGLGVTLLTQTKTRQRAIEEAHREKKVQLYLSLLNFISELLMATKPELGITPKTENEMIIELAKFRTEMSLWASPAVLNAFSEITHVDEKDPSPKTILSKIDPLYKAMRKDIGLGNLGLGANFFAKSILSDPSEFDRI